MFKRKIIMVIIFLMVISVAVFFYFQINKFELVQLSERASYLNSTQELEKDAAKSLERLIKNAEEDGMCLIVMSSYRTYEDQERLYKKYGDKRAKKPGYSEHEKGIAVDFGGCPMTNGKRDDTAERLELRDDFKELPEYNWLVKNAKNYKFIQSYNDASEIIEEPWHWKYNN